MLSCVKVSLVMMQYYLISTRSVGFHLVYLGDLRSADHITYFPASVNDLFMVALTPDKYIKVFETLTLMLMAA